MYPITYSRKKSLTSFLVLGVFSYLMLAAGSFYVAPDPVKVAETFLMKDPEYASHILELNQVGLVPVDATDTMSKYIVQPGDTLSQIATRFGTTVQHLKNTNNITGVLRPGKELFVTETNGIIYNMKEDTNYLLFANKYDLDLEDVMTLNYVVKEDASLSKGDEVFLPITLEKAYVLGLEERPKPKPKPVVVQQPVRNTQYKSQQKSVAQQTKKTPSTTVAAAPVPKPKPKPKPAPSPVPQPTVTTSAPAPSANAPYKGKVVATWWDGSTQVNNGFYKGYCTYWAAKMRPDIFPYTSATTQSRPFGGNANAWLYGARNAGLATGSTPRVGAIAVFRTGAYGHVGIVIKIDWSRRLFLMEEMNGPSGRGYVNHRWISFDTSGVSGYIY